MHTDTAQIRRLALASQGLQGHARFGHGREGTLAAIEHLAYVQIDTISRVERAHHHVLWSRVPDYQPEHLNALLAERRVFEYWFHAASYLPMRDYRFALRRMQAVRNSTWARYTSLPAALTADTLQKIRDEGPLRVRDLGQGKGKSGNWWDWGPGKRVVEKLFLQGDLMVCQRIGMEKVFDLSERVLPAGLDMREPDLADFAAYLLDSNVRAHGVVTFEQVAHLHTDPALKKTLRELLAAKVASGEIRQLGHERTAPFYAAASAGESPRPAAPTVHLLSPFDNAIIHRRRLAQIFGFDYKLECYVPEGKRKFGYFCLPVLYGEEFVGRIDCKAHRQTRTLEVISLHQEAVTSDDEKFIATFIAQVQRFARFNGCETIRFPAATGHPPALFKALHAKTIAAMEQGVTA